MHPVATWIVSAAAVVTAITVLFHRALLPFYRRVLKPAWRGVVRLDAALPILLRVAEEEFKPNGGNSLRDRVDRLEKKVDSIHATLGEIADLRLVIEKRAPRKTVR